MSLAGLLKFYGVAVVLFLVIDLAWLGFLARDFYQKHLGHLFRADVNWSAAAVFYLLYVAGLVGFVIAPAHERGSLAYALWMGGFFGVVAYAAYDLTNLATLEGFPAVVAIVDLAWGFVLTATVCAGAYKIGGWLIGS